MKNFISPSILNVQKEKVLEMLSLLPPCVTHVDVMDGVFVPNNTLDFLSPEFVASIPGRKSVHLMVENAAEYVEKYSDCCDEVYVHSESKKVGESVEKAREFGLDIGVAIKPKTPSDAIASRKDAFNGAMVMTVEPGFGGQKFIQDCVPKIAKCRELFGEKDVWVDGGVNAETISLAKNAGANAFVVGSALFKANDVRKTFEEMTEKLAGSLYKR